MCSPNYPNIRQHRPLALRPYHKGFNEGKITGSVGSAIIIGAMCQAGALPLPIIGMFTVFAGCMGYLTGGFGGAHLSEMWYLKNSSTVLSSMPGLLGGGILGTLGGILGTIIFMGPLILSSNLDSPKNTKNPDELMINNTKFTIGYSQNPFDPVKNETENNTELNGELPGENIEV
jgi:hypothetical protein